jgi:hypothetical protein
MAPPPFIMPSPDVYA